MRANLLLAALWIGCAAVAVAVGMGAISLLGRDLDSSQAAPLGRTTIQRELAEERHEPTPAPPARDDGRRRATAARTFSTPGGSALVRCAGATATLSSWSPAQGYEVDDDEIVRGPADAVQVRFESDERIVSLTATCRGGRPEGAVVSRPEDD